MTYLIIQFTGADVVVARFYRHKGSIAFLQGVRRPLPEPGAFCELLNGFDQAEREEKVILSIPPSLVHSRPVSLPVSDRRRLRELLPLEMSGELASQSEEMVFDALPLADGTALAVWCRPSEIAPMIAELASCGMEPEIVTCSLLHWNHLLSAGTELPVAVTDANAVMVGDAAAPLLARPLPAVETERELSRTLSAFEISRGTTVAGLLRIGADAGNDSSVALNPELLEAFGADAAAGRDIAGAYAVAKACCEGSIVNFRSGSLAYTAEQTRQLRRLRVTAILATVLVLLLFLEVGLRYYLARRDVASLDASIAAIYREIFPSRKKPVDAVGEVRSEIRRLAGAGSSSRALPVLKKLAEIKGEEITGFYEIDLDNDKLQIKGDARSVNEFKSRAEKALPGSEISEIKSKSDGTVSFVLRAPLKEVSR